MATDFGTDITAIPALSFEQKTGIANLGEAMARRFQTPPGGLFYDEEYGRDLRELVNRRFTDDMIHEEAAGIAAEAEKDARILAADASLERMGDRDYKLTLTLDTAEGPFALVMAIGAVTVEVLHADAL